MGAGSGVQFDSSLWLSEVSSFLGGFLGLEGCLGVSGVLLVRVCVCGDQIKGVGAGWQLGFRRRESSASAHPHLTRSSINLTAHPKDLQLREVLGRGRDYESPREPLSLWSRTHNATGKPSFWKPRPQGNPYFLMTRSRSHSLGTQAREAVTGGP